MPNHVSMHLVLLAIFCMHCARSLGLAVCVPQLAAPLCSLSQFLLSLVVLAVMLMRRRGDVVGGNG